MDKFSITIDTTDLKAIEEKYGTELMLKAYGVVQTYTQRIVSEAKDIIDQEGYRDTGRLIQSIKPSLKAYAFKVTGELNAGTKYARFIHEGAEHEGDTITPHFVPFSVAPSLLRWAKRHGIVENIRGDWYFVDKNNRGHLIKDINKSGMKVYTRPTKFFEIPFNNVKEAFIKEMESLIGGGTN